MKNEQEFITIQKATKVYGIKPQTLRCWDKSGCLQSSRTPTNIRLFRVSDIEKILGISNSQEQLEGEEEKICYCRVSSNKQRDDLERQIKHLKQLYPTHTIITDIGSGINYNRKGLQTLLVKSMSGKLKEVVVAHKDRLARFGYELIEFIFRTNNTQLTILDRTIDKTSEQELSEDLLAIVHVFACKQMGKRRYSSKNEENKDLSNPITEEDS